MSAPVGQTLMQLPQKTHADVGERDVVLRGDAGVEAAAGDGDRERVLGVRRRTPRRTCSRGCSVA